MYKVVTTQRFDRTFSKIPVNWQKRIIQKIEDVAVNPYAANNNLKRMQGRNGYRLRVGDWRIIYELRDKELIMLVVEMGSRGGIY